jgi:branched-chain amino acid transport system substrate-binding protein
MYTSFRLADRFGQHRRPARWGWAMTAMAIAAAGVLMVSGCSSSGSTTASSVAGSSAPSSAKSQIVLGVLGSFGGVEASSGGPAKPAIQAWADAVNAAGGVDGHQIKLIVDEDNGVASTAVADAHALIQQDHVVALLDDWSTADGDWAAYVQSQGVPVIGGNDQVTFSSYSDFFPSGTSFIDLIQGFMQAGHAAGITKVAVPYCSEIANCSDAAGLVGQLAKKTGIKVTWSGPFSSTAPFYTSQCLAAQQSGAQALIISAASTADVRFANACAQQGFKVPELSSASTITNAWLTAPAMNGMIGTEENALWFDNSTPALQAFHAAMQKYEPSASINAASIMAWASGKLFEAAYQAAGSPDNVTPAQVKTGLYALKDETLDGLAPPLTFSPGKVNDIKCYFVIGIKDGKYTAPQGEKTSCVP